MQSGHQMHGLYSTHLVEAQAHELTHFVVAVLQHTRFAVLRCQRQQLRLLVGAICTDAGARFTGQWARMLLPLQPFGAIPFPLAPGVLAPNVVRVRVDGQSHGKRCGRAGHEILLLRVLALLVARVTIEERAALDVSRRALQRVLRLRGDDKMMAFARHRRTVMQEGPP